MNSKKFSLSEIIFVFLGGLVLLFILAPLVGLYVNSSVSDVVNVARDDAVTKSIWLTIWTSMLGTLILSVAAIPLSYLIARKNFPFKNLIKGIIKLPVVIPHSAAGIALLMVLSKSSILGSVVNKLGFDFIGSPFGIMVAMAYVSVPYLITSAIDGFLSVPEKLEIAAKNLGASDTKMFFTISLPLAWRHILSGLTFMWARGMSEFGAVVFIAYHPMITPVMIFERFGAFGLKYARPISVLFVSICLILFVSIHTFIYTRKKYDRY